MASKDLSFLLLLPILVLVIMISTCNPAEAATCTILKQLIRRRSDLGDHHLVDISLENYCRSWMLNVEVNNIRGFENVPGECSGVIGSYMVQSLQYNSDVQRTAEECVLYLTNFFTLSVDGKDAWIFDVDETLLSTVPYYKDRQFGAEMRNVSALEEWMKEGKAPVIDHALCLYNHVKNLGLKVFLISSRKEHLRSVTVDNLITAGYHGWTDLVLKSPVDVDMGLGEFKAAARKEIEARGYRIWAAVSSQWSSLFGDPSPMRIFKLPNPMYYEI